MGRKLNCQASNRSAIADCRLDSVTAAEDYWTNGFAVLKGLLNLRQVLQCRAAIAELIACGQSSLSTRIAYEQALPKPFSDAFNRPFGRVRKLENFCGDSRALDDLANLPAMHRIVDRILPGERYIINEMALLKPARIGSEKAWHQDAAYFRLDAPQQMIGVWIALDACSSRNGCLKVLPKSHRAGPQPHFCVGLPESCRCADVDLDDQEYLELSPGDCILLHPYLIHASEANESKDPRWAVQFHYRSERCQQVSLKEHAKLFHDSAGNYAGCTPSDDPVSRASHINPIHRKVNRYALPQD